MAERYKPRVCGRSLRGIAGSNPAGGTDVILGSVVRTATGRSSSKGVLPTLVSLCVAVAPERENHRGDVYVTGHKHRSRL